VDDPPQDGHLQDRSHIKHMANGDRHLDHQRFQPLLSDALRPYPIRLFDGNNKIAKYRLVPFEQRLEYKDSPNTAVYDHVNKILYLNGTVPHAGTLYIRYIRTTSDFTTIPIRFGYSRHGRTSSFRCSPSASTKAESIMTTSMHGWLPITAPWPKLTVKQLEGWDNELQLIEQEGYEPYERSDGWRPDHINL
jgi:hypothetical protein